MHCAFLQVNLAPTADNALHLLIVIRRRVLHMPWVVNMTVAINLAIGHLHCCMPWKPQRSVPRPVASNQAWETFFVYLYKHPTW